MIRYFCSLFLLGFISLAAAQAQVPEGIQYQAIARDNTGALLINTNVGLRITLIDSSASGVQVYTEEHNTTTNNYGLFTLKIGDGFNVTGTLSGVAWSTGNKWIKIELDPTGGSTYTNMGTFELLTVPYAFYAGGAGSGGLAGPTGATGPAGTNGADGATGATGPTGDPATDDQTLSWNGGNFTLSISGGNSVVLPISGGSVGPTGLAGATGATGPTGATGSAGTNGNNGLNGATGSQGTTGVTGSTGATGPTGNSGIAGATGATGTTGATGISGTNGVTGATGPTGAGGGTLDNAYDFGGAGAGRTITVDAGAVELTGSTASAVNLVVTHTGNGVAIAADNSSAATTLPTVQATTSSTSNLVSAIIGSTSGAAYGVAGQVEATATAETGIYGSNLRTTGGEGVFGIGFNGMVGQANNVQGSGVFGLNTQEASGSTSNVAAGVVAQGFYGGVGQTQTNGGTGAYGLNVAPDHTGTTYDNAGAAGLGFIGVLGQTNTANVGFGLLSGDDIGAVGNIYANGTITAGGVKPFRIDDPLDPANKFLFHFALESPEVLNMYRGNVELDANGEAVVQLPAYFHDVNINFSYNLTPVGAPAPGLYISKEISNGTFTIAGGAPGLKVSWQVLTERNDPYLQQNPQLREVEVDKKPHQVGYYVHPEVYGFGSDKAIIRVNNPLMSSPVQVPVTGEQSLLHTVKW